MTPEAIYILGGGLVQDDGVWRTTHFDERGDNFGALGDRLRVDAAFALHQKYPEVRIVCAGGKGQLKNNPEAPTIASVLAKELYALGVPQGLITQEDTSNNTHDQLLHMKMLIEQYGWQSILVITNLWHLPRARTFFECEDALRGVAAAVTLRDAETILTESDFARWNEVIRLAYASSEMQERIKKEEQGIRDLRNGAYEI